MKILSDTKQQRLQSKSSAHVCSTKLSVLWKQAVSRRNTLRGRPSVGVFPRILICPCDCVLRYNRLSMQTRIIMRPSSLGGAAYCVALVRLSVCPSVCPSVPLSSVTSRHLANYNDTLRAAYRTAISAAQTCLP